MNTSRTIGLALASVFAVAFLLGLGANTGQAQVMFDPGDSEKATGIANLDVGGTPYNVAFTPTQTTADQVYGEFPGVFDFDTNAGAAAAVEAVNVALIAADARTVGAEGSAGVPFYRVGFESGFENDVESVFFWEAVKADGPEDPWVRNADPDVDSYNAGQRMWADFTVVPEPTGIWLLGCALVALGVVRKR